MAGTESIYRKIHQSLKSHLRYISRDKPQLRERIRTGRYSFSDLDDTLVHIGRIFCDEEHGIPTKGSIRYGDCMAVPDDRGVVHLVYLGVPSANFAHTIVAVLMPEDVMEDDLVERELVRMWQHKNVDMADVEMYVPASLVKNNGPGLDIEYRDARSIVGLINRWFEAEMFVTNRVRVGDFMETRLKRGENRGMRARIEATENGFMTMIGSKMDHENDIEEWRTIWQSASLEESLLFAVADSHTRSEYITELIDLAYDVNGVLRYLNGSMYGVLESSDSIYLVKSWMVYEIDTQLHDVLFNSGLELRDAISLCG